MLGSYAKNRMIIAGLACLLCGAGMQDCTPQEAGDPIAIGEAHILPSEFGEDRRVLVHLPRSYRNTQDGYPVLYVLDGDYHFTHAVGTTEYMGGIDTPSMIVIAVTHSDRFFDSSPNIIPDVINSGGADRFLRFLGEELFPWVEANYRTQPFRIVFGHSLTGMLCVYTLITRPDTFHGYIAASPHMGYYNDYMLEFAPEHIEKNVSWPKWLYMTDAGEYGYTPRIKRFISILKSKHVRDLRQRFVEMKSETHGRVPLKSLQDGLLFIFNDWRIHDPEDIAAISADKLRAHHRKASKIYGYTTKISQYQLNEMGYKALEKNDRKKAVGLFQYNVELYPDSPNVYDSLGEAYEISGEYELAAEQYETALEKAQSTGSGAINTYRHHLYRVKRKIETNR